MPKIKSHRGAAKRFRATASGRLKHKRPNRSHLLTCKARKRKRHLRSPDLLGGADNRNMRKILPYL
jgi:large subunit ribosomal protein L35